MIGVMAFSETDIEFIEEWADRWCELFDLLFEAIRTDNKPASLYGKPNQLDELHYKDLSSWFIDNELHFLPIWKKYTESQNWSLDISENLIQQIHDGEKDLENPFRALYSVKSLDDLLHYIADSKDCYPTEKEAWSVAVALLNASSMAAEFVGGINNEHEPF